MKALEDLENQSEDSVKDHIRASYQTTDVDRFNILVAYESVGSWGCDSSSFFLLQERGTGDLYEVHGSHCSCYGFEGQWEPERTTKEYLLSGNFTAYAGGYSAMNTEALRSEVLRAVSQLS